MRQVKSKWRFGYTKRTYLENPIHSFLKGIFLNTLIIFEEKVS